MLVRLCVWVAQAIRLG